MHIIKKSILDLDKEGSVFYELSNKFSCSYGVGMTIRKFTYESTAHESDSFSMDNFKEIFYDWAAGEPYTKKKIKETLEISNFIDSKAQINANFSDENSQLTHAETDPYIEKFWEEVANHITLPPTHVFFYDPDFDSAFTCGIYWQFCYIYLNDATKQGIVLSAYAFS